MPTQTEHAGKTVARTIFQAAVGLCVILPFVISAATNDADPATYPAFVVTALAISGGVTRVMAIPGVNAWLNRYLPWLGAPEETK